MIFKGNGSVWNPTKNKSIVNFNDISEYETEDPKEIEILLRCGQAEGILEYAEPIEDEPITLSKKEIIEILKERDINFNPRDKKEVLESLLYKE